MEVKVLKWMFGDWRLWLIAGLGVWAIGAAGRWVAVPIQMRVRVEMRATQSERYKVTEDTTKTLLSNADSSSPSVFGDYLLLFGGLRLRETGEVQGWFSATYTRVTIDLVVMPWLALAVMALCGLLAIWWVRSMEAAWKWQLPFLLLSLYGYNTLLQEAGLLSSMTEGQNMTPSLGIAGSLLHVVVVGALSGGIAVLLSRRFPREMVARAGATAMRQAQGFAADPNVQRTVRQAVTGAMAIGTKVAQGVSDGFNNTPMAGWKCCPMCGNPFRRGTMGHPDTCSNCLWPLNNLQPDHMQCPSCGLPSLTGTKFCPHCGKLRQMA